MTEPSSDTTPHANADEVAELRELGASEAELVEFAEQLDELRLILTMLPGRREFTRDEVADQAGIDRQTAAAFRRLLGFFDDDPTAIVGLESDVEFMRTLGRAIDLIGERDMARFMRTVGESTTRIADAATSIFLLNVELPRRPEPNVTDPRSIGIAGVLVDGLTNAVNHLIREKFVDVRRINDIGVAGDYEVQPLTVGFADLANSTRLADNLSLAEIGDLLVHFEEITAGIITEHRGRVIKLIGDEVLFRAHTAAEAVAIGTSIAEQAQADADLPPVRVGLAGGTILTRSGDVFGTPVNLAARLVKKAAIGTLLMTEQIWEEAGRPEPASADRLMLDGYDDPVAVRRLTPRSTAS